jgi:argininosuccinate synthase
MHKGKVILAYSGGLDTSVAIKWLQEKGYEVITLTADVGQQIDLEATKAKALKTGVASA